MPHIFSYGTLINKRIREFSGESGDTFPALVSGLSRSWSVPIPTLKSFSALGVEYNETSHCVGVVVDIPDSHIARFDVQEAEYNRELVDIHNVSKLDGGDIPSEVWIFIPKQPKFASSSYPIVQTYVDAALAGCLSVSMDFAADFIRSTVGWNRPWVDDRESPKYPHALDGLDYAQIDKVLASVLGSTFLKRKTISFV